MIDILTGTAFGAQKRMNHREDELTAQFPSSASSRRRGLLALKACNWMTRKSDVDIWVEGSYYAVSGAIMERADCSRIDAFVPVVGGHSVTWRWAASGSSAVAPIIAYRDGVRVDYWSANSASGARTFTVPASADSVRFAVLTADKGVASLHDNTDDRWIIKDGRLV